MNLKEVRTILDNVDLEENTRVRIKINEAGLYKIREIDSFDFINGEIVFNIKY